MEERITVNGGSGGSTYQSKTYQCHLELFFNDKGIEPLTSNGLGKSKKEARKVGIRHLVTLLIQDGLIKYGLKDKSFLRESRKLSDEKNKDFQRDLKVDHSQEERNKRLKKEIKRLGKRMQDALKEDNFVEACQFFCQIICNKMPEWNEIAQIWGYAICKKNITYVRAILDLIQYKRINKDVVDETESKDLSLDAKTAKSREETQSVLQQMYGFGRIRCQNPYDIVVVSHHQDKQSFDYLSTDFHRSGSLNFLVDPVNPEDFEVNVDMLTSKVQPMHHEEVDELLSLASDSKDKKSDPSTAAIDSDKGMAEFDPFQCNLRIDPTTSKEFKEPNINYICYRLVNEMYEMLIYSGDMQFAVHAAETLYSRTKLDDEDFISPYASYYYSQRRNMLEVDLIEAFYRTYLNLHSDPQGLVKITGTVSKIGYKFKQQVVVFNPAHMDSPNWDYFVIRRGTTVPREVHSIRDNCRLNEKEYVLLMTVEDDGKLKPDSEFNELLASEIGNNYHALTKQYNKQITLEHIKSSPFFQKFVRMGKTVTRLMVGYIIDISKDYSIKLYTLPASDDTSSFNDPSLQWLLVRLPIHGHHQASFQALEIYTTRVCSNPVISHLLFSPPLTSKSHIQNICNTKANFEIQQGSRIKGQIKSFLNTLTDKLDDSQLKALEFSLTHFVTLIHAPSCSGKLATMVQIVNAWLNISQSNVLVCAESNLKADLLHHALINSGINSIRVMTSPDESESHHLSQNLVESIHKMQDNSHYNAFYVRYPILKKIITSASVVCVTLDALVSEYFASCVFPRVIIDDASSTCESLLLAALTKNCQHFVLFGDHKSLPPKVVSEMSVSKGMRLSLFERYGLLSRLAKQGYPLTFLDTQYMISPSIAFFASHKFYAGKLKSGVDPGQTPLVEGFPWPNPDVGIAIVNITHSEEVLQYSLQNSKFAATDLERPKQSCRF